MSQNIPELRRILTLYINRPSKLGYGETNVEELYQFTDSLFTMCEENADPKFEYDGDTICSICTEYYLEDEIAEQQRVKFQNCYHQAHKYCIADRLKKNATCCDIASCYDKNDWDKSWKDAILNEIQQKEIKIQPPSIPQYVQPKQAKQQSSIQKNEICPICSKAFIGFNNTTSNPTCSHVYCNPCYSKMISDYKVGGFYKETDVICKGCKQPLDLTPISEIDKQYWNKIVQQRDADFMKQFM